jgi:chorismate mutase
MIYKSKSKSKIEIRVWKRKKRMLRKLIDLVYPQGKEKSEAIPLSESRMASAEIGRFFN